MSNPRLTVTIPLPPVKVAQNASREGAWKSKSRARKNYRETCGFLALNAMRRAGIARPAFDRATLYATFYCAPRKGDGLYRPLDGGNATGAIKAAIDGLVDAGVFPSDDHKTLRQMPPVLLRVKEEHQGRAEVVLEIESWEENT